MGSNPGATVGGTVVYVEEEVGGGWKMLLLWEGRCVCWDGRSFWRKIGGNACVFVRHRGLEDAAVAAVSFGTGVGRDSWPGGRRGQGLKAGV